MIRDFPADLHFTGFSGEHRIVAILWTLFAPRNNPTDARIPPASRRAASGHAERRGRLAACHAAMPPANSLTLATPWR